jgi:hypothetical protein
MVAPGAPAVPPPLHLLSSTRMPFAPRTPAGVRRVWQGTDSEERFRKRPHPTLGPDDVDYRFNAHGYRCAEFDAPREAGTLSVVSLGASEVLGTGVPVENTFTQEFTRLLSARLRRPLVGWNLGVGGCSADCVVRLLVSALPVLRPDVVLMTFPHPARREHLGDDGRVHCHNREGPARRRLTERLLDPEHYALTEANLDLSSTHNDTINLYKNYKVCEALCRASPAMWLFTATRDAFFDPIAHLVDAAHRVRPGIGDLKSDSGAGADAALARDMQHPGIAVHREMAARMLRQLEACHADRLDELAGTAVAA